ncbi:type III secretion system regulator InvE [Serratia quinivorans]|uniref:type III secretion system gatekeeper subunit SctW n=1 Tax=Serratia quinivorans TaxID=137545 RepID=UPI0021792FD8|nr:type III secretion system gatekeeper subunit SctW [Serratia quinivorans]CAI1904628.1 type III secretion system regulator InvE [Serratia quinivorans]
MAISPLGGTSRIFVNNNAPGQNADAAEVLDDSEASLRGQGVIDNSSEYASMAMLASQFTRRKELKSQSEESSLFTEKILDDQADEKINRIEQALLREMRTPQQLKAFLQSFFSDPSDMLMALFELLRRKKLSEAMEKSLETLKEELVGGEQARAAMSGANVALVAKAFSHQLAQTPAQLRMLYREFIGYDGPAIYLYEQWIEELERQERDRLLRFFSRALSSDLQGLPPGCINMIEFACLFRQVGRLREIQSADYQFVERITGIEFIQGERFNAREFERLFIAGIRHVSNYDETLNHFISEKLSIASMGCKAIFLQVLITAYSTIAIDLFISAELRDELLELLRQKMEFIRIKENVLLDKRMLHDFEQDNS